MFNRATFGIRLNLPASRSFTICVIRTSQATNATQATGNLAKHTWGYLRLLFCSNPTCRRAVQDVRHKPKLLIRVVLPVQEVLILVGQPLLVKRLLLRPSLLLCSIDTHLLTVLVLTQLTKGASPLQRLVVPCHT